MVKKTQTFRVYNPYSVWRASEIKRGHDLLTATQKVVIRYVFYAQIKKTR